MRTSLAIPTRALLEEFDRWHRQVLGVPAVIHGGKDAKLIAGFCRTHGVDFVRELMADFFETDDAWIKQCGFSVGVFLSQAPKLIARRPRSRPRIDWRDECKELHGSRCTNAHFHAAEIDKVRAL